jgi:carboxylesterase
MARVLCLHGLGGTGATMWPVVAALSAADHTVLAPTLPGHGGEPDDLVGMEWANWLAAAREWPADGPADIVVGQSMGALLALALAAEGRAGAVVAINPPAPDPDAVDGLEWRQSRGHDWVEVGQSELGELAYDRLPIGALLAMHTGAMSVPLDRVVVPVLIVTSELDEVVDPGSSDVVAAALGGPVQRLRLARGGHVATLDADRDRLTSAIVTFASRRA